MAATNVQAVNGTWNVDCPGTWAITTHRRNATTPETTDTTTSTDTATFGLSLTADPTITVGANRNIGGITFSNTSANKYTRSGGNLLLTWGRDPNHPGKWEPYRHDQHSHCHPGQRRHGQFHGRCHIAYQHSEHRCNHRGLHDHGPPEALAIQQPQKRRQSEWRLAVSRGRPLRSGNGLHPTGGHRLAQGGLADARVPRRGGDALGEKLCKAATSSSATMTQWFISHPRNQTRHRSEDHRRHRGRADRRGRLRPSRTSGNRRRHPLPRKQSSLL